MSMRRDDADHGPAAREATGEVLHCRGASATVRWRTEIGLQIPRCGNAERPPAGLPGGSRPRLLAVGVAVVGKSTAVIPCRLRAICRRAPNAWCKCLLQGDMIAFSIKDVGVCS
jgi:hypothetical protein